MSKFVGWIKTHVWQSIVIGISSCLVIGAGVTVPIVLLNNKPQEEEEEEPEKKLPCPDGTHIDNDGDYICDVCGFPVEHKESTKVSGDPGASFYLKIGETRNLKTTLSPTPEVEKEKTFTWKNSDKELAELVVDTSDTRKATVTGLQPGNVTFTSTNDYNKSLVQEYNAKVIDFNDDDMYLWEYKTEDRAQFGYVNEDGKKQGVADGTAVLNDVEWEFHRSNCSSLQSSGGAIGFGKGQEPETTVQLVNKNTRKVNKITLETWSSKGLANLTIKVGETEVYNKLTNKDVQQVSTAKLAGLEGDISIQFDTPAFDPDRIDDPDYYQPGAVYLKSIWIEYEEIDYGYVNSVTYDLQSKFLAGESDPDFSKLTSSYKELTISDETNHIHINFQKIMKDETAKKIGNFAQNNGYIDVVLDNKEQVIKKITLLYELGSNAQTYEMVTSVFGGAPYTDLIQSGKSGKLSKVLVEENVNAVRFDPVKKTETSNTYKIGLKSITVKTIARNQLVVNELTLPEDAAPNKIKYKVGETFQPAGLPDISVTFADAEAPAKLIPANSLTYYDGQTYDEKGELSTFLLEGTTEVVGILNEKEIRVDGLEVVLVKLNFEKVTDLAQIDESSRYLVTSPDDHAFALGTAGADLNTGKGTYKDSEIVFGDTMFIPDSFENDLFKIEVNTTTGKYTFKSADETRTWGVTKSFSASVSYKSAAYKEWDFEFVDEPEVAGTLNISMSFHDDDKDTDFTENLYFTGTAFNVGKNKGTSSNVVLYKLTSIGE